LQRLRQWFNNHMRATGSSGKGRRKVLDLSGKSKRQRADWQIYSTLYYKTKLKEPIQEAWAAKWRQEKPDEVIPKVSLAFCNEQIRESYATETAEIIAEVEAKRAEEVKRKDTVDAEVDDGLDPEMKKAAQLEGYQRCATTTSPSICGD
jgi:hypothetical protein